MLNFFLENVRFSASDAAARPGTDGDAPAGPEAHVAPNEPAPPPHAAPRAAEDGATPPAVHAGQRAPQAPVHVPQSGPVSGKWTLSGFRAGHLNYCHFARGMVL